jgi:thioredoxin 1
MIHFCPLKLFVIILLFPLLAFYVIESDGLAQGRPSVEDLYPALASQALKYAKPVPLDGGVLMVSENLVIKESEVIREISRADRGIQTQLQKNAFYVLERLATRKILLQEAFKSGMKIKGNRDQFIAGFLTMIVRDTPVTSEELKQFYQENRFMLGDPPTDQLNDPIREFLKEQKKRTAMQKYIQTLGLRRNIQVNQDWLKRQSLIAQNNPLDRIRLAGKPSLIVFGAIADCPCEMVGPIIEKLGKKYRDKVNCLIIQFREEKILAARFAVDSIPAFLFFNQEGRELYRHTGFLPESELEKKMAKNGLI